MKTGKSSAIVWILGAIGVFIICSIIQGICGSSMFSDRYVSTNNLLFEILVNITFWPGWLITIGLLVGGLLKLWQQRDQKK